MDQDNMNQGGNNQNGVPPSTTSTPPSMQHDKSGSGPLIATILILAIIVLGGLYFLGSRIEDKMPDDGLVEGEQSDEITASLEMQSESDDLESIEADLEANNYDNLDQGAAAMEAEL